MGIFAGPALADGMYSPAQIRAMSGGGASASAAPDGAQTGTASAPAPTPPPAAPAGSVQTAPGFTPDWSNLIQNDSGYLSAKANADQAQGAASAQRKSALQQAIIRYGGLPSGFTDQYGDVGQDTLDSAKQNQFSTLAQLQRNYGQNENQLRRGLAARGALQSGDLNYGEDQLQNAYGQQQYDAANAAGSDINGALNAYTGVLQGNAQNLSGALQGAEQSVYANPGYTPTAPSTANYDASNSTTYGQPIYVDATGSMFDQNGNPFSPPSPPSASAAPGGAEAPASGDTYFNPASGATQMYAPARGVWAS